MFSAQNGGWEYPLYLTVLAAAQALRGEGAFALSRARGGRALRATAVPA